MWVKLSSLEVQTMLRQCSSSTLVILPNTLQGVVFTLEKQCQRQFHAVAVENLLTVCGWQANCCALIFSPSLSHATPINASSFLLCPSLCEVSLVRSATNFNCSSLNGNYAKNKSRVQKYGAEVELTTKRRRNSSE